LIRDLILDTGSRPFALQCWK